MSHILPSRLRGTTPKPRLFACFQMPVFIVCVLLLSQSDDPRDILNVPAADNAGYVSSIDNFFFAGPEVTARPQEAAIDVNPTQVPNIPANVPTSMPPPATTGVAVPVEERTATPPSVTEAHAVYAPITRLVIPSVGIDAAIEVQSLDPDGAMQTPSGPNVVSWYDFSSQPVDPGNAVFAGHLDYAGYGPAIFWTLGEVQPGAVVEVHHADGAVARYSITSITQFAATDDASGVVTSLGRPTITLITCDGEFDQAGRAYADRLVVTGDRID